MWLPIVSRKALTTFLAVWARYFLKATSPGAERYEITVDRDVRAEMRDGVLLWADIYRPVAEGRDWNSSPFSDQRESDPIT